MQYLVIGANGYVGSHLYKCMKRDRLDVVGTRHHRAGEQGLIYYDVLTDSISDIARSMTDKEKTAIFCIAQADLERCKTEYGASEQINVIAAKRVLQELVQEGFHVIYFSTDNVFDGERGGYTEQDRTCAVNQYGKMKEEMERYIFRQYPQICVLRMPRVVGTERERANLLTDLENKLEDDVIRCIKGNKMSIIAKDDIYHACIIASQRKMRGLYNLANGEIHSRKELAERFFAAMGADKNIVELELKEFGFKDTRPLNTSLDNSRFREETGYSFMTYDMLIDQYLVKYGYKEK